MKYRAIIVVAVVIVALAPVARAVGLFVQPSEVTVTARVGEERTVSLVARNPSGDVALFEAYPDDASSPVTVAPASFTLQSGEERTVVVRVRPREAGRLETAVALTARPLAALGLQAGAGVKVPFHVVATEGTAGLAMAVTFFGSGIGVSIGLLVGLAVVLLLVFAYRRRGFER